MFPGSISKEVGSSPGQIPHTSARTPTIAPATEHIEGLFKQVLAPSTKNVYHQAWAWLTDCQTHLSIPVTNLSSLPLTPHDMLIHISYLHLTGLAPSIITTYTSAIGFVHKSSVQ